MMLSKFNTKIKTKICCLLIQQERSWRFVEGQMQDDHKALNNALESFKDNNSLFKTGLVVEFANLSKKIENNNSLLLMFLRLALEIDDTVLSNYITDSGRKLKLTKSSVANNYFDEHADIENISKIISEIKLINEYAKK